MDTLDTRPVHLLPIPRAFCCLSKDFLHPTPLPLLIAPKRRGEMQMELRLGQIGKGMQKGEAERMGKAGELGGDSGQW